ncbi:DUF7336 domain-containing protein [Acetobacter persici]|uniref:DUF7336 domain-containing protein n=1 Tax=Acetobacter persici TaxID=1076596 RepID=UPI001BAAB5E1|nr:hypothetical protein [Acetobacter persici]MBS1015413.1 hypothetical protein [Acetobacter persici]
MNVFVLIYDQPDFETTVVGVFSSKEQALLSAEKLIDDEDRSYQLRYFKVLETEMNVNRMIIKK